jgi:hypothetical protein
MRSRAAWPGISLVTLAVLQGQGSADEEARMLRIIGIVVGIAVCFLVQLVFDSPWYVWLPAGTVAYLLVRYIGWALFERRRLNREMAEIVDKKYRR